MSSYNFFSLSFFEFAFEVARLFFTNVVLFTWSRLQRHIEEWNPIIEKDLSFLSLATPRLKNCFMMQFLYVSESTQRNESVSLSFKVYFKPTRTYTEQKVDHATNTITIWLLFNNKKQLQARECFVDACQRNVIIYSEIIFGNLFILMMKSDATLA